VGWREEKAADTVLSKAGIDTETEDKELVGWREEEAADAVLS